MLPEQESLSLIGQDVLKDVTSPDIADLQKRFDIMTSQGDGSKSDDDGDLDSEVELPEHLQALVDKALAQME